MIGSTGTGKSSQADKLSKELKIDILSADNVEYLTNSADDNEIELNIMEEYLDQLDRENSFILDGTNINKPTRNLYMTMAKRKGYNITGYDFGPGNEISLNRKT